MSKRPDDFLHRQRQTPPPDFAQRLLDDLQREEVPPAPQTARHSRRDRPLTLVASVAVMLVFSVLLLAVAGGGSPRYALISAEPGEPEAVVRPWTQPPRLELQRLAWSPHGSELIVAAYEALLIYSDALQLRRSWPIPPMDITTMASSPGGQYIAIGDAAGDLYLWRASDGELVGRYPELHAGAITHMIFTRDVRLVTVGTDGQMIVLDVQNMNDRPRWLSSMQLGQPQTGLGITDLALHPLTDEIWAATERGWVFQLEISRGGELRVILDTGPEADPNPYRPAAQSLAFSAAATTLYLVNDDALHIVRADDQQRLYEVPVVPGSRVRANRGNLRLIAFSPEAAVILVDAANGEHIPVALARNRQQTLLDAAINPAGTRLAVLNSASEVVMWQLDSDAELAMWQRIGLSAVELARDQPTVQRLD